MKKINLYGADIMGLSIIILILIGGFLTNWYYGKIKENTALIVNSTTKEEFLENLNSKKEYNYSDVCKKAYNLKVKLSEIEKIQYVCKGFYSDIIELEKLDNSLPF